MRSVVKDYGFLATPRRSAQIDTPSSIRLDSYVKPIQMREKRPTIAYGAEGDMLRLPPMQSNRNQFTKQYDSASPPRPAKRHIPGTTVYQPRPTEFPSLNEILDAQLGTKKIGISGLKVKSTAEDQKPVETHMISRDKRIFFTTQSTDLLHTQGAKDKQWVPGPGHHGDGGIKVWSNDTSFTGQKFMKKKRTTIAGELLIKHSKPENSSPGPAAYKNDEAKIKNLNRTRGMYEFRQKRKNYFDSVQELSIADHQSAGKYESIDPHKHKEKRDRYTKINKCGQRFPNTRADGPGCAEYNADKGLDRTQRSSERCLFGKSPQVSYFDSQAKLTVSPGPVGKGSMIKCLDMLASYSPGKGRKRM